MRLPTHYIPHGGGPCFFMDWTRGPSDTWDRMRAWLEGVVDSLPERPRAILVISGHWEEDVPTVQDSPGPDLLFDYYGFPEHTYQLTWPAPGSPELAERVRGLLREAGIEHGTERARGYDHGVFVPLKVAIPDASIPTVALSLRADLDPAKHLALGRALAPLRSEGVWIVGSGMSFHNMRLFGHPDTLRISKVFDDWLGEAVQDPARREAALGRWAEAPAGRISHPREEHLLPLMVAAGAASEDRGEVVFRDEVLGAVVSAVRFG